jgi:hypothetical protein
MVLQIRHVSVPPRLALRDMSGIAGRCFFIAALDKGKAAGVNRSSLSRRHHDDRVSGQHGQPAADRGAATVRFAGVAI